MNKHPDMKVVKSDNVGFGREEPIPEGHVKREPNACYLPFPLTVVLPGASTTIATQPQLPFKGSRLVVSPDCDVSVHDIKIGNAHVLFDNGGGSAPSAAFPPLPTDVKDMEFMLKLEKLLRLDMPGCQVSQIISIRVTNHSDKPQTFRGMIWGIAIP